MDSKWEEHSTREKGVCKGPEAEMCMEYLKNSKKSSAKLIIKIVKDESTEERGGQIRLGLWVNVKT
jgi:hypothetical protein